VNTAVDFGGAVVVICPDLALGHSVPVKPTTLATRRVVVPATPSPRNCRFAWIPFAAGATGRTTLDQTTPSIPIASAASLWSERAPEDIFTHPDLLSVSSSSLLDESEDVGTRGDNSRLRSGLGNMIG
jgi:hypothetical protein